MFASIEKLSRYTQLGMASFHIILFLRDFLQHNLFARGGCDILTSREEAFMAMYSSRDPYFEQTGWSGKGKAMSEEEYHELERLSPDRKYEYINGLAYLMSGGSVAHDQIRRNIESTLARQLRPGPCRVFGVDVQVLVGKKKDGKPHYVYPDTTVSCHAADGHQDNPLSEPPRVVVEVLSPCTATKDRGIKFKTYPNY